MTQAPQGVSTSSAVGTGPMWRGIPAGDVRSQLLAETLRRFGRARLRVTGTSMLPSLWPGDVVELVRWDASTLRKGDVVLTQREGRLYCHRLLALTRSDGRLCLRTRGDHLTEEDPPVPEDALLGKVRSVHRAWVLPCSWLLDRGLAAALFRHAARISGCKISNWLLKVAAS